MILSFVFALLSLGITKSDETTSPPSQTEIYKLCLDINKIILTGVQWTSQMKWAQTEGIFYVYDPNDSSKTFKSLKFPIIPEIKDKESPSTESIPTEFSFNANESRVGCWMKPEFHELNIRFKVYQFYHTALKAVTMVQTPSIQSKEAILNITLNTLPYQYKDANVEIDCTFKWEKQQIALTPPTPGTPPISPVQPPTDADTQIDVKQSFDSDEISDNIIVADKETEDDNTENREQDILIDTPSEQQEENEVVDIPVIAGNDYNNNNNSTDWMFIAALCSSMLGLFVLVYICLWAYKSYGRKEYESIGSKIGSAKGNKLGKIRKISLRNIGIGGNGRKDERKNIMHPTASYTFNE